MVYSYKRMKDIETETSVPGDLTMQPGIIQFISLNKHGHTDK